MAEPPPTDELPELARLALAWAPPRARPATAALLALDSRLATLLRQMREPLLGQMRLAWWRDRLGESPERWPRGDPVLDALRHWPDPPALVPLVDGWEALLGEGLDAEVFAHGRGQGFATLARTLGEALAADAALAAGRIWALADLAANLSAPAERAAVLALGAAAGPPPRLPKSLRALAVLAGLGWRSLASGGGPLLAGRGSAIAALRIGALGR